MQVVTYQDTDPKFQPTLTNLTTRLSARLEGSGDLCSPTQTPLLKQASFSEFLCRSQEPVDFTFLAFGFKKNKDPANLYPLRYIRGVTRKLQQFYVGSDSKNKDTGSQQELKLDQIKKIDKITTFFASPKEVSGPLKDRYKRRIVAIIIGYTGLDDQAHEQLICSPSSAFYDIGQQHPDDIQNNCLEYLNTYARNNPNYFIAFEENAAGLAFYPDPTEPQKRIHVTNVAFDSVVGASKQYIANLALISVLSVKPSELIPAGVETITFQMPFRVNTTGDKISLEVESSTTEAYRTVEATQKTHNFSVGIPNLSVGLPGGPSVAIGQIAGYTYGSTHGKEVENTSGQAASSKFTLTVPATAYVLDNLQSSKGFEAVSRIKLYDGSQKEVLELSVPTSVPCFNVTDADDLTEAIVDSI
ncbi:hypothetical protein [Roseibium sp.]|uniref:hypothetical protein n=1 Tax=Roseibium sp. TaxID=1936156 RepID=UPI003A96A9F6